VAGSQADTSLRGFARGPALLGRLDAMVDGVADHVHEGVGKFDLLAGLAREIADQARHALEEVADRDHAHGHGSMLDVGGDAGKLRHGALQPGAANGGDIGVVAQQGLGDDHFADHVNKMVELTGVHLDGTGSRAR